MVAIGGWGDEEGFRRAAASEESRDRFARNVKTMLDDTGADGKRVDLICNPRRLFKDPNTNCF